MKKLISFFGWFRNSPIWIKLVLFVIILLIGWLIKPMLIKSKVNQTQYQTAQAEVGTLTIIVNASGQVSQTNSATIDTQASGVVNKVYATNGQKVKTGDKIAEIDLDLVGKQRSSSAWSSYQSAKNSLENAKINYYTLQSDLLTNWKSFMDIAQSSMYENSDKTPNTTNRQLPQYMTVNDQWLSAEAKYNQQANVVAQSQTALNTAWLSYQQSSSTIYAPISGTVTGLVLQPGSVLTAQSNSSGTATSQKIASIQTDASPIVQVNLSQIDTPKVKIDNKATLTFDAFPGKTYTGKVVSIDTIGAISSGVTTYPSYIKLDTIVPDIFSNMTATAFIITQIKDNALLVPAGAVETQEGQSFVRVLKSGNIQQTQVNTGLSSGAQTEIVSGISEGDTVVISSAASSSTGTTQSRNGQSQSPFSSFGGAFRGR